jgi:hypothetical protein
MRTSPSIVPHGTDEDTYLVLDDFGRLGCAWRETDVESANRETLVRHLLKGEYNNPLRVVVFNIAEGWCRDVTRDIAAELAQACADRGETPSCIADFIADHTRPSRVR